MKFTSIEEHIPKVDHKIPISVCLDMPDAERWENVKQRLKKVNNRARIADFARRSICEMLTNLEELLNDHDNSKNLPGGNR
jgi:hypothetical protein